VNVNDTITTWEQDRQERADDEARAQAAGLGVDPAFIAQRERVARTVWIEIPE
jgi:hypothetical protein